MAPSEAGFLQLNGAISPDGRWIAYESNQTGQNEIYVRPYPDTEASRWQITSSAGSKPLWSRDGRELYFQLGRIAERQMASVTVANVPPGAAFSPGPILPLFDLRPYFVFTGRTWDVARDGRFVMLKSAFPGPDRQEGRVIVIHNWFEELRQRVKN
jgi:serine/threonine-protein kinase